MSSFAEYTKKRKKKDEDSILETSFTDYTRMVLGDDVEINDIAPFFDDTDLEKEDKKLDSGISFGIEAPVKEKEEKERTWFNKGALDDGILKGYAGSTKDLAQNILTGIVGMGEKAVDAFMYLAPAMAMSQQAQNNPTYQFDIKEYREMQKNSAEFIEKDLYDEEKVVKVLTDSPVTDKFGIDTEKHSVFGEKSDALAQSAGQLGGTIALQAVGVPWWATTGSTSFGSEAENALKQGATYDQAGGSALITAGAEILTEKLSGGIKFGGKTLDDVTLKPLTEQITNKTLKSLANVGIDATGEGAEEVISSVFSNLGTSLYKEENIEELLTSEEALDEYIESFIGGAVLGGSMSTINTVTEENASKKEANENLITENEQKVIDKEVEKRTKDQELSEKEIKEIRKDVERDLERGYLDIDTIESAIGGETLEAYNSIVEQEETLKKEIEGLKTDPRPQAQTRRAEAEAELKALTESTEKTELKDRLSLEVEEIAKADRLSETYNERTRRSQAFEADLTKYDEKTQVTVKRAVESGILNNTNRTHEFVDLLAKLSAEKGVSFDFTNNENLKKSGFSIEGATINGLVKGNEVILNTDSQKALNSVVGHEVTHVLEGTDLYSELQTAIFEYANTKGEFDTRFGAIKKLYNGQFEGTEAEIDAKLQKELTADLVGDYLFTDSDFINSLSTTKPNVFKKIYEEIKYLYKLATAGSKEARQLEKVKKAFDNVYKQTYSPQHSAESAEYALTKTADTKVADRLSPSEWNVVKSSVANHQKLNHSYQKTADGDIIIPIGNKLVYTDANYDSPGISKVIEIDSEYEGDIDYAREELYAVEKGESTIEEAYEVIRLFTKVENINEYETENRANDGKYDRRTGRGKGKSDSYHNNFMQERIRSANEIIHSVNNENAKASSEDGVFFDAQEEYFKDSVVRDENGKLKPMYHGTSKGGHTVFDPYGASKYGLFGVGSYFTDSKSVAESYTEKGKGNSKQVYETYLNITNPVDMDAQANPEAWKKALPEANFPESGTNEDFYRAMEEYFADNEYAKWEASEMALETLESMGYDGITHIGGGRYNKADGTRHQVYIAFHSEQIKNIDNTSPTTNPDIRFSLSEDSEGNPVSPAVQKRFSNSKAVDENGSLKLLYHGTPAGEFTIFDKSKGSIEGDFGSGFYFTDNEADVEANYEGGGPDFENKVARRAEQIEADEDIDYDEAERRAREELYKGSNKFEVYLNIENPAVVGETILLSQEEYLEQYSEDDYDDYDDYIAEVEQLVADDIENILWEVEKNVDLYSTDGIAGVLYEAYYEGGIGIEDLKARINELYLEDNEGNMAGNEVTRQIIESLGYDGIIDSTVSSKFRNMGMEEGTTHYIVFKPNQIKSITNQNPTDNPDINMSLSENKQNIAPVGKYQVYGKDIALQKPTVATEEAVAPTQPTVTAEEAVVDEYAPLTETEANERDAMQSDRLYSLNENDMPEEVEAPYSEPVEAESPFDERDIKDVGNRNQKAYMYENPEVKPYFQEEARNMLYELGNSIKGEKHFNDQLYYDTNGEQGWFGTTRETSEQIAYLLDNFNYTYADIEKGLKAIIEDHGAENIAVAKRIEFMLDERLREGYTDFLSGTKIPANQDYVTLLAERQAVPYSDEAYSEYLESLVGVEPTDNVVPAEDIAPTKAYEAIEPEPQNLDALEAQWAKNKMKRVKSEKQEAEQIARVLDTEPVTESDRNNRKWAIFKANVFDKGAVFEDLALKKRNRELIGKWNYTLYSEARAQRLMGNGDTEAGIKSLNDIRAQVESTGLTKQFYEYMYHKHNVDRMKLEERFSTEETEVKNKPVFGYSVTADVSQEIVDQYEFAQPEFMDYAKDVYNYQNYLRQQLVENGVISQETADLWQNMYPHYVPIRRIDDGNSTKIDVPLDTGRTSVNAPIKKATGGNTDILPLFDTMAMRTLQTYRATAKNSFGVELKNTLGTTVENASTNVDEVIDSIDTQESLLQEGKNGRKPTFTVFENGERITFEITDDMYDAFKPISDSSMLSKTIKPLNVASNFHRGLLTEYNPVFILTNGIKDIQDVLINSQHAVKTYTKIPEAFLQLTTKGYWYNEYMNNGGDTNSYFDSDTGTFKTENKGLAKLLDLPPLSTISKLNNYVEMIPRLSEYIASRESGRSVEVSMLDSARVTTNFRAGGDFTKFLNRNGATFLNASVQGAMQQVRNVREAKANGLKGWANLATKFAVAGAPAFLLNALLWDDDDDYEELSDYVKQNYYIVGKYDDGKFIRIPKGRTVAVIQDAMKQISDVSTGNDEADLKSFLELVVTNLAPANPIENNIVAPIIQVKNNETWYGDELVPTRLADLPASEQYDESTDSISKWLGEKLDISPVKINYLLDQYSGGVGDVVLPMLTPEAESGDNSVAGNIIAPLKKKFTVDSVINNQNVTDFYDTSEELTTNAKMSTATDEDVLQNKYINSVKGEMSDLYKKKREIQNSNLPDAEKYAQVREIQSQIVELSKEGLKSHKGVNISGDYATVGDRHYKRSESGEWTKLTEKQLEKQEEVTGGLGISASEYWSDKEEYDYAYEKPEKYAMTKALGGYDTYKSYTSELKDIKADKDENGKSISGSRKEKVLNYVDSLNADYGEKIILFKSEYPADDTYNEDIIEYLNNREDISYSEMETILKELGFTVGSDGTISW